jgi:hypothetical protein
MNYAEARQRESDKRWDWTVRNDDRIWRSEPCSGHEDGHETREEAERHFWEWEMAQPFSVFVEERHLRRCEICNEWTDARVRMYDGYKTLVLCSIHQNRLSIEQLYPFAPGRALIYS